MQYTVYPCLGPVCHRFTISLIVCEHFKLYKFTQSQSTNLSPLNKAHVLHLRIYVLHLMKVIRRKKTLNVFRPICILLISHYRWLYFAHHQYYKLFHLSLHQIVTAECYLPRVRVLLLLIATDIKRMEHFSTVSAEYSKVLQCTVCGLKGSIVHIWVHLNIRMAQNTISVIPLFKPGL